MNKKEKIKKLREQVAIHYDSVCKICLKKKRVMQFHHYEYHKDELTHKDFKNNLDYQLYILPTIIARPENFEYLCRHDHWEVTRHAKSKEARVRLERTLDVVRNTK